MKPGDIYKSSGTGGYEIILGVDNENNAFLHTWSPWDRPGMHCGSEGIGAIARVDSTIPHSLRGKQYVGNLWEIIKEVDPDADISALSEFLENG